MSIYLDCLLEHKPLPWQSRLTPAGQSLAAQEADRRYLQDADTLADWIGGQCFQKSRVDVDATLRAVLTGRAPMDSATVPELLVIARDRTNTMAVRLSALDALLLKFDREHFDYRQRLEDDATDAIARG